MSQKQQDAAIQKWFSHIIDEKQREGEIKMARENIKSGIISYSEWVKSTLLMNRINQVNEKQASIELLKSLNGKIHPRTGNDSGKAGSFIDSLLSYYIGKHGRDDVNAFMSECKSEKPIKKKKDMKEEKKFGFFGNW